ncbi:hypothetical protein [Methylobacterium sp. WL7]|uniref:hypothetical protein n=1 Tax=Methylobacterium sp. WL7 TaxID=2603900 RepID=UPI0011C7629D|nr:hypothetical protein [Methylobacterium sp. WL7]TXN38932.1 hypothetical protein FV233_28655 [Methylobacterium sp. WL7]
MFAQRRDAYVIQTLSIPQAADRFHDFRSLGGNCEFSFVQRKAGCEASGLLRFSFTPIESLIHALTTNFKEFDAPGDLYLEASAGNTYYCFSRRYAISSNLAEFVGDRDPHEVLAEAYSRIKHLKLTLLDELANGSKIFVRRLILDETEEQFDRLADAIHHHGPSTVVLVKEDANGAYPTWDHQTARPVAPGVIKGSVRKFAPMERAWDVDLESWLWLCDDVYTLHHGVPINTLYPVPKNPQATFPPDSDCTIIRNAKTGSAPTRDRSPQQILNKINFTYSKHGFGHQKIFREAQFLRSLVKIALNMKTRMFQNANAGNACGRPGNFNMTMTFLLM